MNLCCEERISKEIKKVKNHNKTTELAMQESINILTENTVVGSSFLYFVKIIQPNNLPQNTLKLCVSAILFSLRAIKLAYRLDHQDIEQARSQF